MILIADSGSTKTDWVLLKDKTIIYKFETIGMNPFFVTEEEIYAELDLKLSKFFFIDINEIHFFGAGCSSPNKSMFLKKIFLKIFTKAIIHIKTDIEGAVLATVTNGQKSIVSILGTGSAFRIFDGKKIVKEYSSLGFILGDEGSGTHIAKELLRKIYYKQLPTFYSKAFFNKYHLDRNDIIENIYSKPFPNRFLAQFTSFCNDYIQEEQIEQIVLNSFRAFFKNHISNINNCKEYKLQFVGSIAYYFQSQLNTVAKEYNCEIENIIQKPLDKIVLKLLK